MTIVPASMKVTVAGGASSEKKAEAPAGAPEATEPTNEEKEKAEAAAKQKAEEEEHEAKMLSEALESFGPNVTVAQVYEKIKACQTADKQMTSDAFDIIIEEAGTFYTARMWKPALERSIEAVAILEAMPEKELKARTGLMGTLVTDKVIVKHNLGAVLHQLGHFDTAVHFYKDAQAMVQAWSPPAGIAKCVCCNSDCREQRLKFIGEMLELAEKKEKASAKKHLNEDGEEADFDHDAFKDKLGEAKALLGIEEEEAEEAPAAEAPAPATAAASGEKSS